MVTAEQTLAPSKKKRSFVQKLCILLCGVLIVSLVAGTMHFERVVANQKTLFYQLQLLRTSIQLFKAIRGYNPPSLEALVTGTFQFGDEEEKYRFLEYPPYDNRGRCSDPFGSPYIYNPSTGWVKSATAGYEYW